MATVDVINTQGEKISQVELAEAIFNVPVKKAVLHMVVRAQLANRRAGTASVKNRSDVAGSRKKLYRQKGTGRARKGDIKSPLMRGGGVIFGPQLRSYSQKITKKVRCSALKMALTRKLQENELKILKDFELERIKTKDFLEIVTKIDAPNALIVTQEGNRRLELSSRNVPGVKVMRVEGVNVYDLLKYDRVVLLEDTIKSLEGRLL